MRPTPSAAFRSCNSRPGRAAVGSGLTLLLAAAMASATEPGSAATTEEAEALAASERSASVQVIGIGKRLSIDTLANALGPALRRELDLRFARAERFDPAEWYDRPGRGPFDVRVWVDVATPGTAQIYFADRRRERFLVRRLEVSTPLREMDLEVLAQVIEWSLRALAQGTIDTLTREEAVQLFRAPEEPIGVDDRADIGAGAVPVDPTPWRRDEGVLPSFSSFYRLGAYSDQIPIMHGPGARAGFDTMLASSAIGAGVAVVYLLPQQHSDERVGLDVRSLIARVEMRGLLTGLASHFGVGAFVASGFETTWWAPQAVAPASYAVVGDDALTTALLATGLVGQVRVTSTLRLDLAVELDLDLAAARFDIATDAGNEPFLVRRRLRPALRIGVELL